MKSLRPYLAVVVILLSAIGLIWLSDLAGQMVCVLALATATAYLFLSTGGAELDKLRGAYQALDEQAKLIVKTDMELSRAQEDLDRKVQGLYTLHELGHRLRSTVSVEDLFRKIDAAFLDQLGFDKGVIALSDGARPGLHVRAAIGYEPEAAAAWQERLNASAAWQALVCGKDILVLNRDELGTDQARAEFLQSLQLNTAIAVPLAVAEGGRGFILVGHEGAFARALPNDAELLSILANQLSIAIENAKLYEELWAERHSLELKVQERTRQLQEANESLQRMNEAKSDFVNAVAHELRTPLTSIKGYAAILSSGQLGPVTSEQAERLNRINKHTNGLSDMVDNLLDVARIEAGRVIMKIQPIAVAELLRNLQDILHPVLQEKRVRLTVDAAGVETCWADAVQLERVFMNLLSNAVKYTPAEGRITVTMRQEPGAIVTRVSDTGSGIAPKDVPRIFDEFYRADNTVNERLKGTGLGLSLVKRIIEAHGGTIQVASTLGQGTTFTFTLPLQLREQAA